MLELAKDIKTELNNNKNWLTFNNVRMNFYGTKKYFIYIYKTIENRKSKLISAGQFLKKENYNIIAINYIIFKEINQDEFNTLIKHEMLHNILNHKDDKCNEEEYTDIHKELRGYMTKKELICELTMRCKF